MTPTTEVGLVKALKFGADFLKSFYSNTGFKTET